MLRVNEVIKWTGAEVLKKGFTKHFQGLSTDTREDVMYKLFVALKGSRYDGHSFIEEAISKGAWGVMCERIEKSPEKEVWILRVKDTVYSLGEIAKGYRQRKKFSVFGITGSVGKTMTKELIWNIMSAAGWTKNPGNYNNLIGVPLSILGVEEEKGVILEMAINTKGEMKRLCEIAEPKYALITTIGESHLQGLGTIDEVEQEKGFIYESVPKSGAVFVNADDERVIRASGRSNARKVYYSTRNKEVDVYGRVSEKRKGVFIEVRWKRGDYTFSVPYVFQELAINALAAISVGLFFGVDYEVMKRGLRNYKGIKGRMEVFKKKGIVLINDSYNANPLSFKVALRFTSRFKGRRILVGGDMLELGGYSKEAHRLLGKHIVEYGFDVVFYKGNMSKYVEEGIRDAGGNVEIRTCEVENRCVSEIQSEIKEGDVVLFKSSNRVGVGRIFEKVIKHLEGKGGF